PDGKSVIVGGLGGGSVRVYPLTARRRPTVLHDAFRPARASELLPGFAVASSAKGMVAATRGAVIRSWNLATGAEAFTVPATGGGKDVAWDAKGDVLAVASVEGGSVSLVDRAGRQVG